MLEFMLSKTPIIIPIKKKKQRTPRGHLNKRSTGKAYPSTIRK